jgi:hypothetical protein
MGVSLFSISRAVLSKLRHVGEGASLDRDGAHFDRYRRLDLLSLTLSPVDSHVAADSDWLLYFGPIALEGSEPVKAVAPGGIEILSKWSARERRLEFSNPEYEKAFVVINGENGTSNRLSP